MNPAIVLSAKGRRVEPFPRDRSGWRALLCRWLVIAVVLAAGGWYMFRMPGRSYDQSLPSLTPEESALRDRLSSHVRTLAGQIGERNVWRYQALQRAAGYIDQELVKAGYSVTGHPYAADAKSMGSGLTFGHLPLCFPHGT